MKRFVLLAAAALLLSGCSLINSRSAGKTEQIPQVIVGNELAAISRLRSIVTAEMALQVEGDGKYATLEELVAKGVMSNPSQGKLTGYRFAVRVKPGGFEATAVPETFGVTGRRSFYVDESSVMRAADKGGLPASASDPEVR
jgi:hypothetical protein